MTKFSAILGALSAAALAVCAASAQAAVRYDFVAQSSYGVGQTNETFSGSFSYLAPTFITSSTTIPITALTSCSAVGSLGSATCRDQDFNVDPVYPWVHFKLQSATTGPVAIAYYFNASDFRTVGTHDSQLLGPQQFAQLTVTNLGGGGVPEPTTWALMIGGFGLAGVTLRRRRAAVAA